MEQPPFDRARPHLEAALAHGPGTHDLEDIRRGIEDGSYLLLVSDRSALVLEIVTYPKLKALNVFLLGGDLAEIKALDPQLLEIARRHGCSLLMGVGRRGFERALNNLGFQPRWTMFAKEVPWA